MFSFSFSNQENINSLVLEKLDLLSTNKKPLSDVFKIDDSSFLLLHLKAIHPPKTPDLYEFWGFIEGLALERKFYSFYDDYKFVLDSFFKYNDISIIKVLIMDECFPMIKLLE